jgi:hypothetical protein
MENVHVMYSGWTLLFLLTDMNILQTVIRLIESVFVCLNVLLFCVYVDFVFVDFFRGT